MSIAIDFGSKYEKSLDELPPPGNNRGEQFGMVKLQIEGFRSQQRWWAFCSFHGVLFCFDTYITEQ